MDKLYQIDLSVRTTQVLVEDRLDGTMRISPHGRSLANHAITSRPIKVAAPPPRRSVKPKPAHLWHRRILPERHKAAATSMT